MNVKALMEQKNKLIEENLALCELMTKEVRSLNDEENDQYEKNEAEIKRLDRDIERLNAQRFNPENKVEKENEVMEKQPEVRTKEQILEIEKRGLADILACNYNTEAAQEFRAGANTPGMQGITLPNGDPTGANIIPETLVLDFLEKVEEHSSVYSRVVKYPVTAGNIELPMELLNGDCGFVGEDEAVGAITMKYKTIKLTQKRIGASMRLTRQLIIDAGFPIVDRALNALAKKMAVAIEKHIFQGDTSKGEDFDGLNVHVQAAVGPITDTDLATKRPIKRVELGAKGVISIDDLMKAYTALHPSFLANSTWTMSREAYNEIAALKDGNGHFYVQNGIVNGTPTPTIFNRPVEISDEMLDSENAKKIKLYFGDLGEAYGMMIKKGVQIYRVNNDSTNVLNATELLVIDMHGDGAVVNPQSVVALCDQAAGE